MTIYIIEMCNPESGFHAFWSTYYTSFFSAEKAVARQIMDDVNYGLGGKYKYLIKPLEPSIYDIGDG